MERIDGVVGNRYADSDLGERIDEHERTGRLEVVRIEAGNRKRSRLRVETDCGTDLGIVLDDPLRAGDVLAVSDERAIVVEFERRDAAVIDLPPATHLGVERAVELGHRVGNQHWDLAVIDGSIYIPVAADRPIIEDVLADHLPAEATVEYEEVDPTLWIDDQTAADTAAGHTHGADGHEHSHGPDSHTHTHGEGDHEHSHDKSDQTPTHVDYRAMSEASDGDEA